MRVVVAMDSFKGTLTAQEACDAVAAGLRALDPAVTIDLCPMADGGEGTAQILASALGGEWVGQTVTGPRPGSTVNADYLWVQSRRSALIEMARASGLTLLEPHDRDPRVTTTQGTGELLRHAKEHNAEEIWLTIGGSATAEGGVGAATALGWRFLDTHGEAFVPVGGNLTDIRSIEPPALPCLPPCRVLSDVTNPLLGPRGAAAVFGPQKGADPDTVAMLEDGLCHLADLIHAQLGIDLSALPGGGGAGGLGAGAVAFLGAEIVEGGSVVAELVGLGRLLDGADWVVTGEGRFDNQSLDGKVVDTVATLALASSARVAVLAGSSELNEADLSEHGIAIVADTASPPGTDRDRASRGRGCPIGNGSRCPRASPRGDGLLGCAAMDGTDLPTAYPHPRGFEDLEVGEQFYIPSRTMTEALFSAFQLASADNHPIHYDREYCRQHGHRDLLAHGFQVLIQSAAGAGNFAHIVGDCLIGFLDQSSRFLAPVYAGDTLYPELTIRELVRQRTTGVVRVASCIRNQDGQVCLEGDQTYLLRLRQPDAATG